MNIKKYQLIQKEIYNMKQIKKKFRIYIVKILKIENNEISIH